MIDSQELTQYRIPTSPEAISRDTIDIERQRAYEAATARHPADPEDYDHNRSEKEQLGGVALTSHRVETATETSQNTIEYVPQAFDELVSFTRAIMWMRKQAKQQSAEQSDFTRAA